MFAEGAWFRTPFCRTLSTPLQLRIRGNLYDIDLTKMEQKNLSTGMVRSIRRTEQSQAADFGRDCVFVCVCGQPSHVCTCARRLTGWFSRVGFGGCFSPFACLGTSLPIR